MKAAVITGASGMLGQALIRLLVKKGISVYAVVRPDSPQNARIPEYSLVKKVECNLSELNLLPDKIGCDCDAFFHFGWGGTFGATRNNMYGQLDNVGGTIDAVEAAHKLNCSVFLGAGSQAEFGRVPDGVKLSSKLKENPETGYGIAKLCAGQMSRAVCREYGIRHIWTRILSVYGPGDKDRTMVMSGICSMLKGESPKYTKGDCVGSGQPRMLKEFITDIRDAANPDQELRFGEVPYYDKQVMYLCADIEELQKDTGFQPATDFKKGIRETVAWRKAVSQEGNYKYENWK